MLEIVSDQTSVRSKLPMIRPSQAEVTSDQTSSRPLSRLMCARSIFQTMYALEDLRIRGHLGLASSTWAVTWGGGRNILGTTNLKAPEFVFRIFSFCPRRYFPSIPIGKYLCPDVRSPDFCAFISRQWCDHQTFVCSYSNFHAFMFRLSGVPQILNDSNFKYHFFEFLKNFRR